MALRWLALLTVILLCGTAFVACVPTALGLRHCICPLCCTAVVAKTLPMPCVLPLPSCLRTLPFLAVLQLILLCGASLILRHPTAADGPVGATEDVGGEAEKVGGAMPKAEAAEAKAEGVGEEAEKVGEAMPKVEAAEAKVEDVGEAAKQVGEAIPKAEAKAEAKAEDAVEDAAELAERERGLLHRHRSGLTERAAQPAPSSAGAEEQGDVVSLSELLR